MNIRFLETVLWLARLRSIKATAEKLCITHTAISNRIASIESDLGVRLFVRSEQGFEPTAEGRRFIDQAQIIIDDYQKLRRMMLDPAEMRGQVRVGAVSTLIPTLFPPLVKTIREEYPHISLSVTTQLSELLLAELDAGRRDIVLVSITPPAEAGVVIVPLLSFSMCFVASPSLGVSLDRPLSPRDLARYPVIGYPHGTPSQARIDSYFADEAQQTVVIHASAAVPTNVQMAASGIGICAVPRAVVRQEIDSGALVELPIAKPFVAVNYVAVFADREHSDLPRGVAALARQAAKLYCQACNPAWAWEDESTDAVQEDM
ncbi:LysR family transcriptional regulator [Bordetella sputigena]|uniref:LysR family transcriptional regulator n=1 Tax=Bordetella sputigena TaxID=1416810 RepID=UPI0039EF017C